MKIPALKKNLIYEIRHNSTSKNNIIDKDKDLNIDKIFVKLDEILSLQKVKYFII